MIISLKFTVAYQRCDYIARAYDVRFQRKKKHKEIPISSSLVQCMCLILVVLTEYKRLYYPFLVLMNLLVLSPKRNGFPVQSVFLRFSLYL